MTVISVRFLTNAPERFARAKFTSAMMEINAQTMPAIQKQDASSKQLTMPPVMTATLAQRQISALGVHASPSLPNHVMTVINAQRIPVTKKQDSVFIS